MINLKQMESSFFAFVEALRISETVRFQGSGHILSKQTL